MTQRILNAEFTHYRSLIAHWHTLVGFIRFGKNSDEEGHCSVVVKDPEKQPNTPENYESILVEADDSDGGQGGYHQKIFTDVQPPFLVGDIVKNDVRKWFRVAGMTVVGKCQAE